MGLFSKRKKKPSMEESSVDVIEKEIKSYRIWKYFLLVDYLFCISLGLLFFLIEYLHYCMILLLFTIISLSALGVVQNRVQHLRFLVYIKKGDP